MDIFSYTVHFPPDSMRPFLEKSKEQNRNSIWFIIRRNCWAGSFSKRQAFGSSRSRHTELDFLYNWKADCGKHRWSTFKEPYSEEFLWIFNCYSPHRGHSGWHQGVWLLRQGSVRGLYVLWGSGDRRKTPKIVLYSSGTWQAWVTHSPCRIVFACTYVSYWKSNSSQWMFIECRVAIQETTSSSTDAAIGSELPGHGSEPPASLSLFA